MEIQWLPSYTSLIHTRLVYSRPEPRPLINKKSISAPEMAILPAPKGTDYIFLHVSSSLPVNSSNTACHQSGLASYTNNLPSLGRVTNRHAPNEQQTPIKIRNPLNRYLSSSPNKQIMREFVRGHSFIARQSDPESRNCSPHLSPDPIRG